QVSVDIGVNEGALGKLGAQIPAGPPRSICQRNTRIGGVRGASAGTQRECQAETRGGIPLKSQLGFKSSRQHRGFRLPVGCGSLSISGAGYSVHERFGPDRLGSMRSDWFSWADIDG